MFPGLRKNPLDKYSWVATILLEQESHVIFQFFMAKQMAYLDVISVSLNKSLLERIWRGGLNWFVWQPRFFKLCKTKQHGQTIQNSKNFSSHLGGLAWYALNYCGKKGAKFLSPNAAVIPGTDQKGVSHDLKSKASQIASTTDWLWFFYKPLNHAASETQGLRNWR